MLYKCRNFYFAPIGSVYKNEYIYCMCGRIMKWYKNTLISVGYTHTDFVKFVLIYVTTQIKKKILSVSWYRSWWTHEVERCVDVATVAYAS